MTEPGNAQTRRGRAGEHGSTGMHDLNGGVGRGGRFGFTENEMKHGTTSVDPNGLRIFELTLMPLRRLLRTCQSLPLRFCAERSASGDEDGAEQHDQQRERDTCPEQQTRSAAAGCSINLTWRHSEFWS